MSITALITGRLIADPERRTGVSGKHFTTARLSAGTDDESVLCSVIAFGSAGEQLVALGKGDTAAIVGRTKPKAWTDREGAPKAGLDVVADQVLTAYSVRRKRAAMAGAGEGAPQPRSELAGRSDGLGGHVPDDEWLQGGT
ncbi:MAG: single-stranded DNA-binding protein [Rubrivivax sp.]